tara:strand:+ start:34 stop:921 length:888 start_codon:yes stop_codon:yes gene_type:complete
MSEKNPNTSGNFVCFKCEYITSHKGDWKKHIKTKKHKKIIKNLGGGDVSKEKYSCKYCKHKSFKTRSGCWKHQQKCLLSKRMRTNKQKQIDRLKEEKLKWKQVAEEATIQNKSLKEKITQGSKSETNIGTQNNTINVNLFLNEHCKNAISILDFIRSLQFTLKDINPDRPISSIESLSNVIIAQLNELEDSKRPVHCSDTKRLKFYVKDASGWVKDDDNEKMDKAIGFANVRHQGAWHHHAAEKGLDHSAKDDYYLKMNIAMGEFSENVKGYKQKMKKAIADATNIKLSKHKITF